jgi:hypothetical protein
MGEMLICPLHFIPFLFKKDVKSIYRVVSEGKKLKGLPSGHCNGVVSCQHTMQGVLMVH